jgi:hypothetical protein
MDHTNSRDTDGRISQTASFIVQRIEGGHQAKSTIIGGRDVFWDKPC